MEDVALNYHPTKFGNNCKTQCGGMDKTDEKTVNLRPQTALQFKDGFRRRINSRTYLQKNAINFNNTPNA